MDWNAVTERLLEMLPPPCGKVSELSAAMDEPVEPISRYTWDLANQLKDHLVASGGKRPTALFPSTDGAIIFEFARSENVLTTVWVRSSEIIVRVFREGAQSMKTMFEGPFEILDAYMKGIAEWLHNLLKSSTTVMKRLSENGGGA